MAKLGARGQDEKVNDSTQHHPWSRYVAVGDSFTEGIGDPEPSSPGGYRGWADRVAEELSRGAEDFKYANLAIRGRLLGQILGEQLEPALELKPDLISISAGGNDLIRPGADPDALAERLDAAVGRMTAAGIRRTPSLLPAARTRATSPPPPHSQSIPPA